MYFSYMLQDEGCRENAWVVSMAAKTKAAQDDLQDLNNTLTARMGNKMGAGHSPGSSSAATLTGGATDARGASESSPRLCVKLSESAESAPSSPSPRSTGSSPWEEAPPSLPPPSGLEPDQKRPRPWHQRRQPSPKSNPRFTVLPQRRWKAPNMSEAKFKAWAQHHHIVTDPDDNSQWYVQLLPEKWDYCLLCNKYCDWTHMTSGTHLDRCKYPASYLYAYMA